MMRQYKFRAWNGKQMDYDYRDACLWNGLLVAEGDTILMQFTGLVDKNGKDIYEGDIVRTENEQENDYPVAAQFKGIVAYEESKAWFYIQQPHDTYRPVLANMAIQSIEVIGNIYESEQHP